MDVRGSTNHEHVGIDRLNAVRSHVDFAESAKTLSDGSATAAVST